MEKSKVFLSYAWGGESEKLVNGLDVAFQDKGIILIRDKRDLGFKGLITEFMARIGKGHAVVAVISDKYLKSPHCMFELLEIYRNLNFQQRIFPVVMEDVKIYDPIHRLQYLKYWQDKKKELTDAVTEFGLDAITVIGDDYKIYKKIVDNYGEVVNILKDMNSLTPELHRESNFKAMIDSVKKCIDIRTGPPVGPPPDYRKKAVLQRLNRLYKLLDEYENKHMLSGIPKEKMAYEDEIKTLNEQIQKVKKELNQP